MVYSVQKKYTQYASFEHRTSIHMENTYHNEPGSALTHFIGILLSIAGLVLMVVFGTIYGSPAHVVGFSIFGTSLILLYSASSAYHILPKYTRKKDILARLDQALIFVLIAGTYTPIALTIPSRGWGWSLFGVIWGIALIGFLLKILSVRIHPTMSVFLYLAMGWLIVIAMYPLLQWLPLEAVWWLIAGGLFYSIGCIFFALEHKVPRTYWFGMHELFHVFVLLGSFSHFWLMLHYITYS